MLEPLNSGDDITNVFNLKFRIFQNLNYKKSSIRIIFYKKGNRYIFRNVLEYRTNFTNWTKIFFILPEL